MEGGEVMGAMNFRVDADAVMRIGEKVTINGGNYVTQKQKIYNAINSLASSWTGDVYKNYVAEVEEDKPTMDALGAAITRQGEFLTKTGMDAKNLKEELLSGASRM